MRWRDIEGNADCPHEAERNRCIWVSAADGQYLFLCSRSLAAVRWKPSGFRLTRAYIARDTRAVPAGFTGPTVLEPHLCGRHVFTDDAITALGTHAVPAGCTRPTFWSRTLSGRRVLTDDAITALETHAVPAGCTRPTFWSRTLCERHVFTDDANGPRQEAERSRCGKG